MHFRYVEATFLIWDFIYFKFIFTNFDVSILTLLLNEPLFDWGKIIFWRISSCWRNETMHLYNQIASKSQWQKYKSHRKKSWKRIEFGVFLTSLYILLGILFFKFSSIPLGKQFCENDNCNHWQCENLISMKALRTYLSWEVTLNWYMLEKLCKSFVVLPVYMW